MISCGKAVPRGMKEEFLKMDGWIKVWRPVMHCVIGSAMILSNGRNFDAGTKPNCKKTA